MACRSDRFVAIGELGADGMDQYNSIPHNEKYMVKLTMTAYSFLGTLGKGVWSDPLNKKGVTITQRAFSMSLLYWFQSGAWRVDHC